MIGVGIKLSSAGRGQFTSDDISGGTLSLSWVDAPEITLSLDFIRQVYQVLEDDSTIPGLVGSYKVKA